MLFDSLFFVRNMKLLCILRAPCVYQYHVMYFVVYNIIMGLGQFHGPTPCSIVLPALIPELLNSI